MKKAVNFLQAHPKTRIIFFWATFYNLRLLKPVEYLVLRELLDCDSILDMGCGRHSMVPIVSSKTRTTGVELFKSHFDEAVRSKRHTEYINADILTVDFPEKSFDAVVLLDVLEHLPKEAGQKLLEKMEKWARKKVVIFTPNGYFHQEEYDENPLMAHQSGWEVPEMKTLGFKVYGVRGFKSLKKYSHEHEETGGHKTPMIESLADITQVATYYLPEKAFQIFCVKNLARP